MALPTSQKADQRPISFSLSNGITGQVVNVPLVIRPEELTRVAPSRMSAINTFGGAWVDNFGRGLASLQISGHTGWRGGLLQDGMSLFQQLKTNVFDQWHAQRASAVSQGQDPKLVQLIFADALDDFVNVVVPLNFTLKRSRSRPLLMMYQISMTVVSEQVDQALLSVISQNPDDVTAAGVDSLNDSVSSLNALNLANFVAAAFVSPFSALLNVANKAFAAVLGAVGTGAQGLGAIPPSIIGIALAVSLAGRNAFFNYNSLGGLSLESQFFTAEAGAIFENVFCLLNNAFLTSLLFPDFISLYGASVCSSTAGGSPLSPLRNVNPWGLIVPSPTSPVAVTTEAQGSLSQLGSIDPVLAPLPMSQVAGLLTSIGQGVTFQ